MRRVIETLFVEDDRDSAKAVSELLFDCHNGFEYRVTVAGDMRTGFTFLASSRFHLLLLDLILPNGKGAALVKGIRDLYPDLPLVVISGMDDDDVMTDSLKAHADLYLTKAQHIESWTEQIRQAVIRREAITEVRAIRGEGTDMLEHALCIGSNNPDMPPYPSPSIKSSDYESDKVQDTVLERKPK